LARWGILRAKSGFLDHHHFFGRCIGWITSPFISEHYSAHKLQILGF
jgi:hypothetical protein